MKLITCSILLLVILEEYYCEAAVNMTRSSWGGYYGVSDSRGFGIKHDDKGYHYVSLPGDGGSGFKKEVHSWSISDNFNSKDDQPERQPHNSVNNVVPADKPVADQIKPPSSSTIIPPTAAPVDTPDGSPNKVNPMRSPNTPSTVAPVHVLTDSPSVTNRPQYARNGAPTSSLYIVPQAPSYGTPNVPMYEPQGGPMYGQPNYPTYGYRPQTEPTYYRPQYGQMYGQQINPNGYHYGPMYLPNPYYY